MTLVGVHDWDNLKRNEGHTHFMIANAVFSRNEGADLIVMTFVPQTQEAVPLNKDTVLCQRLQDGAIPWRVAMEMSPVNDDADFGAWRLCPTFSDGPSRWVQVTALQVCPLFCTRCIRNRAPNDDVAAALQQVEQRNTRQKTVEKAAQVDGLEAIVNPERTLCMWFRPHPDGSKRRHLAQVDVLFRSEWMYDESRIEKSELVHPEDDCVVISSGDGKGVYEDAAAVEAGEMCEDTGEACDIASVGGGEQQDDAMSHSTTSSSVVFSKYVGREGGRAATRKDWDDRMATRKERRRNARTKKSRDEEQSAMVTSNTEKDDES